MKTYRITKKDIEGMKPVAVGYKIFNNDWSCNDYCYADENGNVLGTIHKVDGDIKACQWGLHFSVKPQNCFNFYGPLQWNKFAKVEAYDCCINKGDKSVTNIIKIIQVYSFDEFIREIQENLQSNGTNWWRCMNWSKCDDGQGVAMSQGVDKSDGVNESNDVFASDGVNKSNGVEASNGVNDSNGVNRSYGVTASYGVSWCNGVNRSQGTHGSQGVNESRGVNWSDGVNGSRGVNKGRGVNWSEGVNGSYGVNGSNCVTASSGVNWSDGVTASNGTHGGRGVNMSQGVNRSQGANRSQGVNESWGVILCEGVSRCLFCYKVSGKLMLFNKSITEDRYNEVFYKINSFNWYPRFNNAEMLKGNLEWYETNIPKIVEIDNKTAWSFMPRQMLNYIKSLPEYDEELFDKITGEVKND